MPSGPANAARSTGPRTTQGKARSAQNSRKHGFAASKFCAIRFDNLDEFAILQAKAIATYQPVNHQEQIAVERIALAQQSLYRYVALDAGLTTAARNEIISPDGFPANRLVQDVAHVVGPELKPERENPGKKIGAGELWIIHKRVAVVDTLGGAIAHFARRENVGVFGQAWYDGGHSLFLARIAWGVARHGEVKKENITTGVHGGSGAHSKSESWSGAFGTLRMGNAASRWRR